MKDRTENLSGNDQQPDHENRTVKKAAIILSDRSFEYDIYTLVIAFFPNIPSPVFNPGEKLPEDADLVVSAILEEETTVLRVEAAAGGSAFSAALLPYSQERILPTGRNGDRAAVKNLLKGSLYEMLRDCTGRDLPWGNLTGIRPVRLAMQFLQEEMGPSQSSKDAERLAGQDMQDAYYVSPGKAALASEIAAREHRILKKIAPQDGYSLYVGIPFCPSICLYCSFSSGTLSVWQKEVDRYLDCLILEIQSCGMHSPHPCFPGKRLQTVYIGGGTPTTLSPEQMDRLLCALEENFPMDTVLEFTVEAGRPDSINAQKLRVLREHHVSRISINPQTMNQETLDLIGRKHTVEETIEAYQLARELGFDNINMDLIVGLPGEGIREVDHTMKVLEELDPDDITVHALALKRAARLAMHMDEYEPISFHASDEIMARCERTCRQLSMSPYYLYRQKNMAGNFENVGYAKPGRAGLYNILIMEEVQSILALGASGSTKIVEGSRISRVENVKDVRSYIDRIDEMIARKDAAR